MREYKVLRDEEIRAMTLGELQEYVFSVKLSELTDEERDTVQRMVDEINGRTCWHKELPKYYVVEGSFNMSADMAKFAERGIRKIEILSKREYEYLCRKKKVRIEDLDWEEINKKLDDNQVVQFDIKIDPI